MSAKLMVPSLRGGLITTTRLASFTAIVGKKRLSFYVLRLPVGEGVTLTESGSLARFRKPIAGGTSRLPAARLVARGRALIKAAVREHGAAHVLEVVARQTKATIRFFRELDE